ncbi:hypothetical protein ES319_A05G280400v1 [Gossypium barbadense]|uniref:Uncharacterized protein n=1 Tax=Gossypium barbadense TaxID=3634 RepID=A0A5J5VVY5_GOSBA|nr:hypothetical protein ES319_A05G280400v1 [Gossypium barbadense]
MFNLFLTSNLPTSLLLPLFSIVFSSSIPNLKLLMILMMLLQPLKQTPLSQSSLKRTVLVHGKQAKLQRSHLSTAPSLGTPPPPMTQNQREVNKSVVEQVKPLGLLRWLKRIGQLFQLIESGRGPASQKCATLAAR